MKPEQLSWLYKISFGVIKGNTAGITHEESLLLPEVGGNNLNWVIGHLIFSRGRILRLLDVEPDVDISQFASYKRGSDPRTEFEFYQFPEMIETFESTQNQLVERLEIVTEEYLEEVIPHFMPDRDVQMRLDQLTFLHFHESYHAGQTGLMRRLIGKDGVIK